MPRRIITEEELREAAREVLEYELAIFDSYNDYPEHVFQGKFRLNMAALIHEVKRGAVKAAKYSMGFTFYAKQCIAAVLLIFTLSCIAMPETVLAGYHKLIEVIETVFEDYTEYRYRVNDDGGIEETFKPLKLGYLPEGMEEVWREETETSVDVVYMDAKKRYLNLFWRNDIENSKAVYVVNNKNIADKYVIAEDCEIFLYFEDDRIRYIEFYDGGHISGQSNLPEEELLKILTNIKK